MSDGNGELKFEDLSWPVTAEQVSRAQTEGKRRAFAQARRSPFFKGRLDGIDPDRLDDPTEWAKIPVLHKEELREIPAERFHETFCIQPDAVAVEYWRSGGSTGRPLFYPRAAEPLSRSKRTKLERMWGAEVYDQFGCTEGAAMGSESDAHDGLHLWSDLFFVEVVDGKTGEPVAYGETGELVMTPLFGNAVTPFLRWNMGDIGSMVERGATTGPLSVFPVFRHTARTMGFFKVRGVNIGHIEFEDFLHRDEAVADFRLEVADGETLDRLILQIELRKGGDSETVASRLKTAIKHTFEVTPEIEVLDVGTLAQIFINDVKAARFIDSRAR